MNIKTTLGYFLGIAGLTLLLDQASKWYILFFLDLPFRDPIPLLPFLNFTMVWNHGVSFGLGGSMGQQSPWIMIGIASVLVVILCIWLFQTHERFNIINLSLIIGGAIGNIIDRIRFGAVADFIDVHVYGYHWPVFNIADSAICIGVVLLCIKAMLEPKKKVPTS